MSELAPVWWSRETWIYSHPQGIGNQVRAQFYQQAYTEGMQPDDAGIGFCNLGSGSGANKDNVGPQTPLTWRVVMNNALSAYVTLLA